MTKVLKTLLAIVLAFVTWFVVATLGNFVLRAAIPDYRVQEAALSFSLAAQLGRLALGLVATFAATWVALLIVRRDARVAIAVGCLLLVFFVPVHVSLWARFPIWYHLVFLASLPVGAVLFGRLIVARQPAARLGVRADRDSHRPG